MQRFLILAVVVLVAAIARERLVSGSTADGANAGSATTSHPIECLTVGQMATRVRRLQAPTILVLYGTASRRS
jgi:hypothetical protein